MVAPPPEGSRQGKGPRNGQAEDSSPEGEEEGGGPTRRGVQPQEPSEGAHEEPEASAPALQ